jgi:hypothetical protein
MLRFFHPNGSQNLTKQYRVQYFGFTSRHFILSRDHKLRLNVRICLNTVQHTRSFLPVKIHECVPEISI